MKTVLALILVAVSAPAFAATPDATVNILINESKVVFTSRMKEFNIEVKGKGLPCRDQSFGMHSKNSLYEGWDPTRAAKFIDEEGDYQEYAFATCRDANTEALAWFTQPRDLEFTPTEQLLDDDYNAKKLPLVVQWRSLPDGKKSYYSCGSAFTRQQIGETDNYKTFRLTAECDAIPTVDKEKRGPIDFISNPGPFAATSSYRGWVLPAVPSTESSFTNVTKALLKQVPAGKYAGVMSTLTKKCEIEVAVKNGELFISHTIIGTKLRTRRLELKAATLIGAVEGEVYADPNRVEKESIGEFAAAQFQREESPLTIRFEKNSNQEGQIIRINGSEAYCRRLVKKK